MDDVRLKNIRGRSEALLIALIGKELAPKWWQSPNRAFNMEKPEDVWKLDPESVYQYLMNHSSYNI